MRKLQIDKRVFDVLRHWRAVLGTLRNKLLAGIVVAVPIVVTGWVLMLAYGLITGLTNRFLKKFGIEFPGLALVVTLLLLIGLGFMATNMLGQKILRAFERLLERVPLVATVYGGVKQVIDSFKSFNSNGSFKRVAYVEYPSEGCRLIGFVTGQYLDNVSQEEVTSIFLPTAPNPMTGFIIVVPSQKVIDSDLSLEEATKMILSAGLVGPKRKTGLTPVSPPPVAGQVV